MAEPGLVAGGPLPRLHHYQPASRPSRPGLRRTSSQRGPCIAGRPSPAARTSASASPQVAGWRGGARGRPPSRSKLCLLLSVDECQRRRPRSAAAAVGRSAARAGGVGVGSSHVCQARSSCCYPASALPAASASLPAVSRSRGPCSCEPRMFAVRKASSGAHPPRPTCLRPAHGSCKGSGGDWARGAALL